MLLVLIEKLFGRGNVYKIITLSENFYLITIILIFLLWFLSFLPIVLLPREVTDVRNNLESSGLSNALQNPKFHSWVLVSIFVAVIFSMNLF